MKISLLTVMAVVLTTAGAVRADEIQFASSQKLGAELQRQAEEIDELKAQLASLRRYSEGAAEYSMAGDSHCNSCGDSCCNSCCNSCTNSCCDQGCSCCPEINYQHTQCGYYAYGEAVIVRPYLAQGFPARAPGINAIVPGEFSLAVTPRVTVGWVGDCGFGVRGRYWQYYQFGGTPQDPNVFDNSINLQVTDLEATDRICLGQWLVTGFGGIRYVRDVNTLSRRDPFIGVGTFRDSFQGLGLTTGLDLIRPVSCNWSLYGNARASFIVGTQNVEGRGFIAGIDNGARHAIRGILEAGLGIQYNRQLANGVGLFGRAGLEIQYWNSGRTDFNTIQGNPFARQDAGFAGLTFGAGLTY